MVHKFFFATYKAGLIGLICSLVSMKALYAQTDGQGVDKYPVEKFYLDTKGPSTFRVFLSKFKLSLFSGYGSTFYKHKLDGFNLLDSNDNLYLFTGDTAGGTIATAHDNWFNDISTQEGVAVNDGIVYSSDSATLGFTSRGASVPLGAMLNYEHKYFRLGLGYTFEYHSVADFSPISFPAGGIRKFTPDFKRGFHKRFYGTVGVPVYRYWDYLLIIDAKIGSWNPGKKFNKGIMKRGVYFNFGATWEREFSEIFRAYVRPSFDIKNYTIAADGISIKHSTPALLVDVGITIGLHPLRRCPVKTCRTQINHVHGGQEYRNRQHPVYKHQNPHYGQNYPVPMQKKRERRKGKKRY